MNVVLILHGIVLVVMAFRVLLRDDVSPPARMAWLMVLLVLPFIGSVVYFLFGEINPGRKPAAVASALMDYRARLGRDPSAVIPKASELIDTRYRTAFDYAASINGFQAAAGNSGRLMGDADETLARMVADIDAACEHVHVLYYIWLDDHTGTALAEALIRAARRGVVVRAMVDGLGSRALIGGALWKRMQDGGVRLAVALPLNNPLRIMLTSRIDLRNHRKITVIDGRVTFCGSRNSADPAFRVKAKYAPWVDIMARFEGPVVAQNQLLFWTDWTHATGEEADPATFRDPPRQGGFPAVVTGFGPSERKGATPQLFLAVTSCAHRSITLSTPYFVPDATVIEALCAAAYRGVAVTLIFPARNDSWIVAAASRSYYRRLLEAGCVIHEYKPGLLHAKTLTVDGTLSLIGSTNLDLRSFDLNFENNILFQDKTLTGAIEERQRSYIADSDEVGLGEVLGWRYTRRIWHNVIATIGPVL